jgi:hypothetical protein
MPTDLNPDLLYTVLDRVVEEDHRGGWAQDTWCNYETIPDPEDHAPEDFELAAARSQARFEASGDFCGTTGCFAAWTLVVAGGTMRSTEQDGYKWAQIVMDGKPVDDIATTAQRLLGLDDHQRSELFAGTRTLAGLKQVVDGIVAGEI